MDVANLIEASGIQEWSDADDEEVDLQNVENPEENEEPSYLMIK